MHLYIFYGAKWISKYLTFPISGVQLFVTLEIRHRRRVTEVFVNNQHDIKRQGQDFDIKFVFERVHSEEVDRRISWEKLDKAWC